MLQNTSSYPSLLAVARQNNGTFVFRMDRLFAAYNGSIITNYDTLSHYLGHRYQHLHLKDPTCCAATSELLAVSLAAVAVRTKKIQACFIIVLWLLECTAESDLQHSQTLLIQTLREP